MIYFYAAAEFYANQSLKLKYITQKSKGKFSVSLSLWLVVTPIGKYHKFNDTCHTTQTTNSCNV